MKRFPLIVFLFALLQVHSFAQSSTPQSLAEDSAQLRHKIDSHQKAAKASGTAGMICLGGSIVFVAAAGFALQNDHTFPSLEPVAEWTFIVALGLAAVGLTLEGVSLLHKKRASRLQKKIQSLSLSPVLYPGLSPGAQARLTLQLGK